MPSKRDGTCTPMLWRFPQIAKTLNRRLQMRSATIHHHDLTALGEVQDDAEYAYLNSPLYG